MVISTIFLDVEGVLFKTSISTLTSVKGSYFERLLQNDWKDRLDTHGHLFIDRDSSIFPLILNYLRDGSIPLPKDEYYLERILREARFFNLHELSDDIERRIVQMSMKTKKPASKHLCDIEDVSNQSINSTTERETTPNIVKQISPLRVSTVAETPLVPARRKGKGKYPDSISLPRNFAHVAHVGWDGGVIFNEELLDKHSTVPAIIEAMNKSDLNPVYNVVSGENGTDTSHTVEVVLAGPLMQTRDPLYSKPKKKLARIPEKPIVPLLNSY